MPHFRQRQVGLSKLCCIFSNCTSSPTASVASVCSLIELAFEKLAEIEKNSFLEDAVYLPDREKVKRTEEKIKRTGKCTGNRRSHFSALQPQPPLRRTEPGSQLQLPVL